ncbi:DUF4276 family protein [uncultured Sphaerotilus sp.]|uniref:DUF4276 family protein n=1 Tax=uncultured Sphaerotilus sp. TaxID=474984 RepID=UPI0030CA3F71
MTVKVSAIVEGDGEVLALPILLRRIWQWQTPDCPVQILTPIRVPRMSLVNRPQEFSRHLQLAASKCGESGWILVLLDADDDCPKALGEQLRERAQQIVPHRPVAVVLANREYEAWFIAAAASLEGHRSLRISRDDAEADAEQPRNAKGWLALRKADRSGYHPVTDQPALSARMDLQMAFDRSRSFRKLCSDWVAKTRLFCPAD